MNTRGAPRCTTSFASARPLLRVGLGRGRGQNAARTPSARLSTSVGPSARGFAKPEREHRVERDELRVHADLVEPPLPPPDARPDGQRAPQCGRGRVVAVGIVLREAEEVLVTERVRELQGGRERRMDQPEPGCSLHGASVSFPVSDTIESPPMDAGTHPKNRSPSRRRPSQLQPTPGERNPTFPASCSFA